MTFTLHGIGVSGGIAIGRAHLVSHASLEVAQYQIKSSEVSGEIARFEAAVKTVRTQLMQLHSEISAVAPSELSAFVSLHQMILDDAVLSIEPKNLIVSLQCNAEWALKQKADEVLERFDAIEDSYLRERRMDVVQVTERVLRELGGQQSKANALPTDTEQGLILVAHDLSPADVVEFKRHQFASFVTDGGGSTSHTAVVARSLNIPSIVGLQRARELIRENEWVIVDGTAGVLIADPDTRILQQYRQRKEIHESARRQLLTLRDTQPVSLDGVAVQLQANIELPEDVKQVKANGATGIGLFRSEFLFLNRSDLPDEEEQFQAYGEVIKAMNGLPVTIRTYDLGADKQIEGSQSTAVNPALGLRAIRLCLIEPHRFLSQLRALLRASTFGPLNILIPMLSSAPEIDQSLQMITRAQRELTQEGLAFDPKVRIGAMIEVPGAALALEMFLKKMDFISIGTNDLIQYTLAIDRTDESVAYLYDPLHPAILSLIFSIIKKANQHKVPVALCGEMAGDAKLTRLLLGLGLRNFSMHSAHILDVKERVLKVSIDGLQKIVKKMLRTREPERLRSLLEELNALEC
jgi:phosphotransferase system enzyme I (PtsI)